MRTGIIGLEQVSEDLSRKFPFADGVSLAATDGWELPNDMFFDAVVHPLVAPGSNVVPRLTGIDFEAGKVTVSTAAVDESDDTVASKQLTGLFADGMIKLYDVRGRYSGLLACGPGWSREAEFRESHVFDGVPFSASVCCQVEVAWVTGFVDSSGVITKERKVSLEGDGCIRPVITNSGRSPELSFDVQTPTTTVSNPLRQLVVIVEGNTVFDAVRLSQSSSLLSTPGMSRDDVKWHAHREMHVSRTASPPSMCQDGSEQVDSDCYSPVRASRDAYIPLYPGVSGSVDIVTPDVVGLNNSAWVGTVKGESDPTAPQYSSRMSQEEIGESVKRLFSRPESHGNGIIIAIPGISNAK